MTTPPAAPPGRRSRPPGWRLWLPLAAFVVTLAVQFALVVAGPADAGLAVVVIGVGMALVFAGLDNPVFAVTLLLVSTFFRRALPEVGVEPYILAFGGVLAASAVAITRRVNQLPRLGAVEVAMGLYVAWNILSALAPHEYPAMLPTTGEDVAVWRFILSGAVLPFTMYVVGRFVFDREPGVRWLLWVLTGLAAYSAAVSVAAFYAPALVWPRYIVSAPEWEHRAVGVFNQPVVNGLVMVLGFVIALYLAAQADEPRWQRVLAAGTALACVPGIYLTHTRVVWLVFALVLVAGTIWARNFRTGFALTLGAACLGVAARWSTLTSSDRSAGGVTSTNEVDDRLNIIATSLWAIQEKPIAGWGIGRFVQVNTYQHKQWSPEINWTRGYSIASHHNELGIAAELGLVGLALWLAVLVLVTTRLVSAIRVLPQDGLCGRNLAFIAATGLGAWFLTGMTVDLRFFNYLNPVVLLLVGIAVGWGERARAGGPGAFLPPTLQAPVTRPRPAPRPIPRPRPRPWKELREQPS